MNKSNVKKILDERLLEKGIENLNNEEQEQLFGNLKEKQKLVDEIFKPDNYGHSEWVFAVDLMKTDLKWGRNGLIRHGIAYGDNRYVWEKHPEFGTIEKLKTSGFNSNLLETLSRPIRKDIERYHKQFGCVVCGSNSKLVKNLFYNGTIERSYKETSITCILSHNTFKNDDFPTFGLPIIVNLGTWSSSLFSSSSGRCSTTLSRSSPVPLPLMADTLNISPSPSE